ncbi:hypothetical protein FACS189472_05890 [Alphaproteobacteria bacterium]|nr:hypothetical protein FACS189472_05890 [Alphaproteobacteria bacterium]
MKAVLCVTEALTQANLKAIHGLAGGAMTDRVKQSVGMDRFEELLSGKGTSNNVITFKLYDDLLDASLAFAQEQETFYFKDTWSQVELNVCDCMIDEVVQLHPRLNLDKCIINSLLITSIWNISGISEYNIHVTDIINALLRNCNEIIFITGKVLNSTEFMAYIYFKQTVKQEQILTIMEEWNQERACTIVHVRNIKNCFVAENKNMPGHYVIQANEIHDSVLALENLIYDERIDPCGCRTSNAEVSLKLFGINETSSRVHEEFLYTGTNLSQTKDILPRHFKTITDSMCSGGNFVWAERDSLKYDLTQDIFNMVRFETAKDMTISSLKRGQVSPIANPVVASVFGELLNMGTGVSKVILYAKLQSSFDVLVDTVKLFFSEVKDNGLELSESSSTGTQDLY